MGKNINKNTAKMLKMLGERKKQSENALYNIGEGFRVTPQIEEVKRLTDLHIKTVQNIPDEFDIPDEMIEITENENELFVQIYGPLFSEKVKIDTNYSPIVSGSSAALAYYQQVSQEDTYKKANMKWAEENIGEFVQLNNELKRKQATENLIRKLNSDIADEFHSAIQDFARLKADIVKIPDLAIRFRTIMEKVKGELNVKLLLPKIQVKSGKILEELANIYTGGIGRPHYNLFCIEIKNFQSFHSILTNIGKSNILYNSADFEVLLTRYIDNLYAILTTLANYRLDILK